MTEKNDFISIYTTGQEDKIAIIKSLLDSKKILYYIANENIASRVHNALDREMHLMVLKDSVNSVKEILRGIITENQEY
ncbi:MAG: hypothetical protein NTZ92_05035 [Candidatus Omnitrophica bacterium]|nr:hypothetical protein [Candidatus Omnitrophota bacterium]